LEIDNRAISAKDSKNNNLLHLCVKYKNHEALKLLFKKTEKKKLIKLLEEKNSYKKTPKRLA
jgi:ankyrin repeat protein